MRDREIDRQTIHMNDTLSHSLKFYGDNDMKEELEILKSQKLKHMEAIEWHLAQIRYLEKEEQIFLESGKPTRIKAEEIEKKCKCDL